MHRGQRAWEKTTRFTKKQSQEVCEWTCVIISCDSFVNTRSCVLTADRRSDWPSRLENLGCSLRRRPPSCVQLTHCSLGRKSADLHQASPTPRVSTPAIVYQLSLHHIWLMFCCSPLPILVHTQLTNARRRVWPRLESFGCPPSIPPSPCLHAAVIQPSKLVAGSPWSRGHCAPVCQ